MDFAVVTSLLGVVEQHLLQPHKSLIILPEDTLIIQTLSRKLRFVPFFLADLPRRVGPELVKSLREEIRCVAAEAEDKIESMLIEVYKGESMAEACQDLLQTLQQLVKDIEAAVERVRDMKSTAVSVDASPIPQKSDLVVSPDLVIDNIMIGHDDEVEVIRNVILSVSRELKIISIVGMPGLGKTTLARKVYMDSAILIHFHIKAWTLVSQEFSKRNFLISILDAISGRITRNDRSDEELEELLYKSLKGLRYFLVMDDMWQLEDWDCVRRCFPDDHNGSRILITTRINEVAEYVSSGRFIHHTRLLSTDEGLHLLATKLLEGNRSLPPELESIGRNIVERCGRLPLAIVVVAGILARHERSPEEWENVARNIGSYLTKPGYGPTSGVLELSYKNLPSQLRACFLYLGAFPRDSNIPVKKLIRLWVAEGFLEPDTQKSLERVAEDSLTDLIDRNLLLVTERSYDGVKSCRLHDMVHGFCLEKAQGESALLISNQYTDDLARTWSGTEQSQPGCRWMSCQSRRWPVSRSNSLNYNWHKIRSVLYFSKDLYLASCRYIFPCFKLLRVFDLSLIKYWHGMPSGIEDLIHLRYLTLTTTGSLSNFQLFKLQFLQTLILLSWVEDCPLQLPSNILDLPLLRHVHLDKGSSLYLPNSVQENLQTLFWLKISGWDSKAPDFTKVPNLEELGIYIEGEVSADALNGLVVLHQLEKLKFETGRVERFNLLTAFPPNLTKLTLCKTYLPWEKMDVIGELPNLEALKLKDFAFCGLEWNPRDEGFQKLKFLLIAHPDLEHWNANEDHFPSLERLVLRNCWCLEELPAEFSCIWQLRVIELIDCCSKLVESAKLILEEARDMGSDLVVRHVLTEDKSKKNESSNEKKESAT